MSDDHDIKVGDAIEVNTKCDVYPLIIGTRGVIVSIFRDYGPYTTYEVMLIDGTTHQLFYHELIPL